MRGFDPEFTDIVDYILRITYRIWEGKQVDLCHKYYSEDCPVYTLAGMTVGAQEVTNNTANTLKAFPDRQLHADAVICGGNDVDGYHSSHLIHTTMTNEGDFEYGAATGNHAQLKVIAHCIIKDNVIVEEWLVRDNYSLAQQLGFDPHVLAQTFANTTPQTRFLQWLNSELERIPEQVNHDPVDHNFDSTNSEEALVSTMLQNVWNAQRLENIATCYTSDARLHASANREFAGTAQINEFYQQFHSTLSDIKCSVDYVCSQNFRVKYGDTLRGRHVAVRWSLTGMHTGAVLYGEPTNAPILIIGESHYHVVDGKIFEEWTVFDELAVLTQVYRARKGN